MRRPALCVASIALVLAVAVPASALASSTTTTVHRVRLNKQGTAPWGDTLLASLTHNITGYAEPGRGKTRVVHADWLGNPITTPIVGLAPGYYQIRLPGRPNGTTTWVSRNQVLTSVTPYRIVVNVTHTWLKLFKSNVLVMKAPAGVGTSQYPTPIGRFFVAFYALPPSPGYGPFIMVTSAHSNTITDWEDSGDAMVAIHGPLGSQAQIEPHGAHVSHGCIRLLLKDQKKLSHVPDGSPVYVIS